MQKTSTFSISSSISSPNLLTVPETGALLISASSSPARPPRNPWRSSYHQPSPISKFNQANQNSNSNLNPLPATNTTTTTTTTTTVTPTTSTPTSTSKHRKHLSTGSLPSIIEHPPDHPPHQPQPSSSSSSSSSSSPDPALETSSTSHMSSSPDSYSLYHHRTHRRHSSAVSPLNLSQPISASPARPISFYQPTSSATAPKSTSGSITKLLTRKLSFLNRKTRVPPNSPNHSALVLPPRSPNRIRSSSVTHQVNHKPSDDSEDAEFASADEGDERFWKHLVVPSPHRHTRSPPMPRSPNRSADPTFKRPTKSAHPTLTRHFQIADSALDPSNHTYNNQTDPTTNRNSLYQPISFTSPTRLRGPSIKKTPAEFRAGRVFVRSSQIFAQPAAATRSYSDPSTASVEESEQDQSSFSSYKPITPSSDFNQTTTPPTIYRSALPSPPSPDEDQSSTKDYSILSRISEPFNSFLSAPNACLSPRRSPSSHSLVYRFNSGVLNRSSPRSTVNGSTNQNGLLQPQPASKSPPVKKTISMTFNLRHVPKFLNQRAKSDHTTDGEKITAHAKPPESRMHIPNPSQLVPIELSPTWRSLVSPDRFLRLEKRYGKLEMKRQELIWELCRTELGYVESLKMIIDMFFRPLKKIQSVTPSGKTASHNWSNIVPDSIANFFENLEDICRLHQEICESIAKNSKAHQAPNRLLIPGDHQTTNADEHLVILKISDTFQSFVHRLKAYENYLIRFESVHRLIDQQIKDPTSKLGEFIRTRSQLEECGKMSFNSFLLKPIQRLMKYPLFFKQLCDVTPVLHPDHLAGQQLWESTDQMIKEMQQVKALKEDWAILKSIENHIIGLPESFQLANGERKLVRRGFVHRFHAVSYLDPKREFGTDDDLQNKLHIPDSPRRTTISSPSSRSSSTAVDKRRRSRSQLSDDWSFSDHIGIRSSMKSTFSSSYTSPLPDIHPNPQRLSRSSFASLKASITPQEYSSPRPDSHQHHRTPLPARPDQQASSLLPTFPSSHGSSKIISRPKQLVPLSSSKTKISDPKLNLKLNGSKLDHLSTHHSSDKHRGTLSNPADRKLKTRLSSSSLSMSTRDQRQVKDTKQAKNLDQHKTDEFLVTECQESKSKGEDESLYLFMFSDGLLLFTRPFVDPHNDPMNRKRADHLQLFRMVAEPFALSSLLAFRVLPSDLPSSRQPHVQSASFNNDSHHLKSEIRQLEKENKEIKDRASGGEGIKRRERRRRAKIEPDAPRKPPSGHVELQVKCAHHVRGDIRLSARKTISLTLGLPGPLPASVAPSIYYALALDQTEDLIRNPKNSRNVQHALDNNDNQNVAHDFVPIDPLAGLAPVGRPELMHSLSLILLP